jgi:hypothetical protein
MKKILLLTLLISILTGCSNGGCTEYPFKVNYIRVGCNVGITDNIKEVYLRLNGSGVFEIKYGNLIQVKNCEQYETVANDVVYFSEITEEEYNKSVGINTSPNLTTSSIDTNITY